MKERNIKENKIDNIENVKEMKSIIMKLVMKIIIKNSSKDSNEDGYEK